MMILIGIEKNSDNENDNNDNNNTTNNNNNDIMTLLLPLIRQLLGNVAGVALEVEDVVAGRPSSASSAVFKNSGLINLIYQILHTL